MKLIVALGNPDPEYLWTRHNFGRLALDFYFKKNNLDWQPHEKFDAIWKKQGDIIFIKPNSYYNNSGHPVRAFADFYKISKENIFVLCDDFNIPFGTIRERQNGSAGGNNGLKSIISTLNTESFPRLRLGTGNDAERKKLGDINFVLGHFTETEKSLLPDLLTKVETQINQFINQN